MKVLASITPEFLRVYILSFYILSWLLLKSLHSFSDPSGCTFLVLPRAGLMSTLSRCIAEEFTECMTQTVLCSLSCSFFTSAFASNLRRRQLPSHSVHKQLLGLPPCQAPRHSMLLQSIWPYFFFVCFLCSEISHIFTLVIGLSFKCFSI